MTEERVPIVERILNANDQLAEQNKARLDRAPWLPAGSVEYGGLYQQQQESFRNLLAVLLAVIAALLNVGR